MIRPLTDPRAVLLALALQQDLDPATIDWAAIGALAGRERMALRLEAWFRARGLSPAPACEAAITAARRHEQEMTTLVARISAYCELRDLPYVLLKTAQTAPDVGRDLDVLLGADATPPAPLPATTIPIDIQYGRLGRLGEHGHFARQVLARRERQEWERGVRALPSAEDRILLLVVSRIYGRPRVRLSDVCHTVQAIRTGAVDLDRLVAHAREADLLDGLSCFLEYVDQAIRRLHGESLLDARSRARLPGGPWGRVTLRDGGFHGPSTRVAPYLLARLFTARVLAGELDAAGRVACLPLAIAARRAWPGTPLRLRLLPHA